MSDVFISHSSKDKEISDMVVKYLEDRGLSCWTAPRDIVPGSEWAAAINTAITASKVFLIIYTANSAESGQVSREVSLAENKPGVFVIPYKTDDTPLKGSFEYYLTGSHIILANYKKKDYKFEELYNIIAEKVNKNINNITNNTYIDSINIEITPEKNEVSYKTKKPLFICLSIATVVIVAAVLIIICSGKNGINTDSTLKNSETSYDTIPSSKEPIAETPPPTVTSTLIPTSAENSPETPANLPESTGTESITIFDESDAKTQLMMYISKYGNHFENENGEYYSIKHSYGAVTIDNGSETQRTIENSMIYLNSRYNTSDNSDWPLELGVYNKDLHLHVWLKYNIKTNSYELSAYEDESTGKNKGTLSIRFKNGFTAKLSENDIYDYSKSVWFSRAEFIRNVENLLTVLCKGIESDLYDMDEPVTLDALELR
ncbi:MAG: toll/interleukin-1 receptor domain-containing protein [Lachnospiraceae bacterium]|nr:toll/interleukin-1 receptor domain-containing protein [Lachnospiraceae bacterium]